MEKNLPKTSQQKKRKRGAPVNMGSQTVSVMVEGGKATAAPPLGPALGPLGVPIGKVVEEINKQTASLKGMQVPVKVIVAQNKTFAIEVGKPPVAALLRKEAKVEKGTAFAGQEWVGNISMDQVKSVAKAKFNSDADPYVNQILGTCKSMGISIGEEGKALLSRKRVVKAEPVPTAAATTAPAAGAPAAAAPAGQPVTKAAAPEKKKEVKKRKVKKGK